MNVLVMGLPFGADDSVVRLFRSERGHEARLLGTAADADFSFSPDESAETVVTRISRDWPVDALVCFCPEMYPPPLEVERCPVRTLAVISDWNIYYPQLEHNLSRYDAVLCDRLGARILRPPGARPQYLFPLYAQRTPTHRNLHLPKDIDVVFVGNLNHAVHAERGRCLEKVAALSDRYRVVIASGKPPEEYARLLNRARIVFNHSLRREMNLRCFETLACGSALFVEASNLEAGDYLRDGVEAVFYTPDNLAHLLEHYLECPEKLNGIARQGHAIAAGLSGEARLDRLFDWLAVQPSPSRAFCNHPEDVCALATVLQYASSLVPEQRALARRLLDASAAAHPAHAEFVAAQGISLLEEARMTSSASSCKELKTSLAHLEHAARLAPDSVPIWMTLAFVARRSKAPAAEIECLERALRCTSPALGGLLPGTMADPCYVRWRWSLAAGTPRVETLWATAAARLAELAFREGRNARARAYARRASAWEPDIPVPWRIRADLALVEGDAAAAARLLEESLPLALFDPLHRTALADAYLKSGERRRAALLADESARIFQACEGMETVAAAMLGLAKDLEHARPQPAP